MIVRAFLAIAMAAAAVGCSSSDSPEATSPGASGPMTVKSQSGQLTIGVRTTPDPPLRGNNAVEFTITGATDGLARDGLVLAVKPWMPAMGHGTSIVPTITPEMDGKYLVSGVDLFMPGLWQLRVTISGPTADYAAPAYEIQ
jgi:hypothetical protein